jgi:hypothetical protein
MSAATPLTGGASGSWQTSVWTVAPGYLRRRSVSLGSAPQFSQLLVMSDKLRVATIRANQQGRKCPNRGRHKILGTGEVDVKFRREEALID